MGHAHHHGAHRSLTLGVLTVSDTRTLETDESGALIARLCEQAGHCVAARILVKDEPDQVREALMSLTARPALQAILITGGTGLSRRDRTVETVSALMERRIEGFGELFRWLSYGQIGPAAMLSRAAAGLVGGRAVFCLPGSPAAVELALEKLILPELAHVVDEAGKES